MFKYNNLKTKLTTILDFSDECGIASKTVSELCKKLSNKNTVWHIVYDTPFILHDSEKHLNMKNPTFPSPQNTLSELFIKPTNETKINKQGVKINKYKSESSSSDTSIFVETYHVNPEILGVKVNYMGNHIHSIDMTEKIKSKALDQIKGYNIKKWRQTNSSGPNPLELNSIATFLHKNRKLHPPTLHAKVVSMIKRLDYNISNIVLLDIIRGLSTTPETSDIKIYLVKHYYK